MAEGIGVALLIAGSLAGLGIPWLIGRIVDLLQDAHAAGRGLDSSMLFKEASFLVGLSVLAGLARFGMRWTMIGSSRHIERELRDELFAKLLALDQGYFLKHSAGDLMSRATNDLNAVRMMLGPGLMYPLNAAVTLAVAISFMIAIDWRLTLIGLIPLPLLSLLIYLLSNRLHRGYLSIQERFSQIVSRTQENLSGIRVVKAFVREEAELERFAEAGRDYYEQNLRMVRLMALFMPSFHLLSGGAVVLVLFFGSRAALAGEISVGQLLALIQYLIMLSWPVMSLGWVTSVIQRGSASWGRILEILDREPAIVSPPGAAQGPALAGDLEIRGLSFAYDGLPVLRDIHLTVPMGGSLGLVGPTGSGKTTLLRLLPRLLDPPPGTVFLAGADVRSLPLDRLRRSIAWVGQEPLLFSESLQDNLCFARPEAPDRERDAAARDAAILDEIRAFPEAWQSQIGERGINLSGGQKQRICLARALLKGAGLIILDAPFSSVDTHTEELILQALRARLAGCTLLLVSHRISTVMHADRIIVLEDGRITESGSHAELLAAGGLYTRMVERQSLEERLREGGLSA